MFFAPKIYALIQIPAGETGRPLAAYVTHARYGDFVARSRAEKKRAFNGHSALGPMCDAEKDWYERSLWRPVLVKIAIIKLPHRSVFSATVVLFISLLCIFMRRLLITFSNVNYFNVSLVKFFIGSTNEFSHSYCNLFLIVLRIIFYFWYPELFFHWR